MWGPHRGVQRVRAVPRRLRRKGGGMGGNATSSGKACGSPVCALATSSRRRTTATSRAAVFTADVPERLSTCASSAASCAWCLHASLL